MVTKTKATPPAPATDGKAAVNVVIARGQIKGSAQVEVLNPGTVIVSRTRPLHVRYAFKLDEVSRQKEEYIFTLRSEAHHAQNEVKPLRLKPLTARMGDRWGVPDSAEGTLQHDYVFEKEGPYTLHFEVEAEYLRLKWGGLKVDHRDRQAKKGTLTITVVDS